MPTQPILNVQAVAGTDGQVPIYRPNDRWCSWNINEIYRGGPGANRYVPKLGDYVEDTEQGLTYLVYEINEVTLIPLMRQIRTYGQTEPLSPDDILTGVGPGTQSDTYRIYLDTSVIPFVFAVDARLKVAGTMTSYAKIFKGADTSAQGDVLSFLYDQAGNFLTQNVPLELVATDSHDNHAIKTVSVCYTNERLKDGELVTAVFYSDTGHVVSKRQLLVENTSFIRSVSSNQKYVSHISLKSPFLSPSSDHVLEYPLNVPLVAYNMFGMVHYSDGTSVEMPVDGSKFQMHGLEHYVSTVVGQEMDLVLSYLLGPTETAYGAVSADGKRITEPFSMVTVNQEGAYTVKLYGYPTWVNSQVGYRMRWFLFNLDRDTFYEVTPYVQYTDNTQYFDPTGYGILQRLSVRINLRDVNGSFRSYIHVQAIDVVLRNQGTERTTNWTVGFDPTQTHYGVGLFAKVHMVNQNLWKVKVDSGLPNLSTWLDSLYYRTSPLKDKGREVVPPRPNFFIVQLGNAAHEFPIEAWNDELTVGHGVEVNSTLMIRFIKRTATNDIQLAIAGLSSYDY